MPRVKKEQPPKASETKACETKACETKACESGVCDAKSCDAKVSEEPVVDMRSKVAELTKAKRAPSPYILFCNQERPKVKADHPDFTFTQVGAELGKRWKNLTKEQQASFKATS